MKPPKKILLYCGGYEDLGGRIRFWLNLNSLFSVFLAEDEPSIIRLLAHGMDAALIWTMNERGEHLASIVESQHVNVVRVVPSNRGTFANRVAEHDRAGMTYALRSAVAKKSGPKSAAERERMAREAA